MAIAFVAASHSGCVDMTNVSSITFAHAPGCVSCGVSYLFINQTCFCCGPQCYTAVTHNCVALTQIASHDLSAVYRQRLYRLTCTQASGNVVVSSASTIQELAAGIVTYSGVCQCTPNDAPELQATDETDACVSDTITTTCGDVVLTGFQTWDDAGSCAEGTAGTERIDIETLFCNPGMSLIVQCIAGACPSVNTTFTKGCATPELLISVSINPAACCGPTFVSPRFMTLGMG